jgi:hypothetical protein
VITPIATNNTISLTVCNKHHHKKIRTLLHIELKDKKDKKDKKHYNRKKHHAFFFLLKKIENIAISTTRHGTLAVFIDVYTYSYSALN